MFRVLLMLEDKSIGIIPIPFDTQDEAWAFINVQMNQPERPRFMWVQKEDQNADS